MLFLLERVGEQKVYDVIKEREARVTGNSIIAHVIRKKIESEKSQHFCNSLRKRTYSFRFTSQISLTGFDCSLN